MKKVKIYSVVSNSNNETTKIEAIADYNSNDCTLSYMEENLSVTIEIFEKRIRMERKNEDYDLNLDFVLNEKKRCKYIVNSIGLNLEIDVYTKILEIEENRIYISYELFNDNNSIGTFEYKLLLMEWLYEHKRKIKRNNWWIIIKNWY